MMIKMDQYLILFSLTISLFSFSNIFAVDDIFYDKNIEYYDSWKYIEQPHLPEQFGIKSKNYDSISHQLAREDSEYGREPTKNYLSEKEYYSNEVNFIAVGDFYCNDETENTIQNIISIDPELIITTGDQIKDVKSLKCWNEMSQPIKNKMKIAIGNHDVEYKKLYMQLVKYHQLINPYYSHDFKNIHFISLSTEHPFEEGSRQYEFIKNDLENVSKNEDIDWIIIHNHKSFYSTRNDIDTARELRNTYLPLFEKYNVDLVISSHNQYYERTYPLLYNYEDDTDPIFLRDDLKPNYYHNPDGIIFLTVGTAGDELQEIVDRKDYYVIQDDDVYGVLNFELTNNGRTLIGTFHDTDDHIILDKFVISKVNQSMRVFSGDPNYINNDYYDYIPIQKEKIDNIYEKMINPLLSNNKIDQQ
jgi:hypothetical protein